ncbi:hypothetical protein [Qipengyuania nanhaisediminis]|uniref:hypothetical protein n=1 Tax=Qipengyuania nanhaisediminis TaxID=604088 RepID=UPI0038B3E7C5
MPSENLQYAILIALGLLFVVLAIWMFMHSTRKTTIVDDETSGSDVLDDGAPPATRNQALIDAPNAVEHTIGQTSANANTQEVAAARADADAEAGAHVDASHAAPGAAQSAADPSPSPAPTPAPAPAPAPATAPAPAGAAADATGADDLSRIKGVGPKLVAMLHQHGITRFEQIASWSDDDIARIDATLGRFSGRIERDHWVEQARLLSSGDETGFAEQFGRNR